jgi:peptidoglycan/xylan/chitin deacetylase (PgdA/CDA1 family)
MDRQMTQPKPFPWPNNKKIAVSLSFDDARLSQIDHGIPLLNRLAVKASFYVSLGALDQRLEGWKAAIAAGHEVGNHTVNHPCSGNFSWSQSRALEDYTADQMERELIDANRAIHERLALTPQTFAYPCGQTFVGRGEKLRSYVPLVARHFLAGRGFRDEVHNAPGFCDLAKLGAFDLDNTPLDGLKSRIRAAAAENAWVIFAGHETAGGEKADGRQTVDNSVLVQLCEFCLDPDNGVWLDTVANIAKYVKAHRGF